MHNKNITVCIEPLNPSKEIHSSILPCQFHWRNTKEFIGENMIAIADMQEPIWWNRPLTSTIFCKVEEDGLCSYNFPFWQNDKANLAFKADYNVLLNKNSVPVAVHIKTDETWTAEQIQLLKTTLEICLQETLIDLGVNSSDLSHIGNDFYFQGRKFSCSEQIFTDGVFTQNTIITMQLLPEKDIFERLTGKYARRKTLTGITEEVSSITKEAFISKFYEKLQAYVEEHFN